MQVCSFNSSNLRFLAGSKFLSKSRDLNLCFLLPFVNQDYIYRNCKYINFRIQNFLHSQVFFEFIRSGVFNAEPLSHHLHKLMLCIEEGVKLFKLIKECGALYQGQYRNQSDLASCTFHYFPAVQTTKEYVLDYLDTASPILTRKSSSI